MKEAQPHLIVSKEIGNDSGRSERAIQFANIIGHLEGVQLDRRQQLGAATIGGAMRVYDSAFDDCSLEEARANGAEMLKILSGKSAGNYHLNASCQKALTLAQESLTPEALNALQDLTSAQIASLQQRESSISEDAIREITRRKGGKAALLFALEVSPGMNRKKQEAYEELGYLMQLVDDFNDKQIDKQERIATIANTIAEPRVLIEIRNQNKKVREIFSNLYEAYKIPELFTYIDRLLASIGILG